MEQPPSKLRTGNHGNPNLQRLWNLDGEAGLSFSVLEAMPNFNKFELEEAEQKWFLHYANSLDFVCLNVRKVARYCDGTVAAPAPQLHFNHLPDPLLFTSKVKSGQMLNSLEFVERELKAASLAFTDADYEPQRAQVEQMLVEVAFLAFQVAQLRKGLDERIPLHSYLPTILNAHELRDWCYRRNISQTDLARLIGLPRDVVADWCSGRVDVPAYVPKLLALIDAP